MTYSAFLLCSTKDSISIKQVYWKSYKPVSYRFFLNYVHITYEVFFFVQKQCLASS